MTIPLWALAFTTGSATLLWLLSLKLRDVSIIDIFWGPGIAGVVDIAAVLGHAGGERASASLFLVNIWSVRLAAHIWARHQGEDRRYAQMRHKFGPRWWWWSFFQIFLLQAILMWFVAAPLVAAMLASRYPMTWMDYAGIGLAALALIYEALADAQLARFRAQPANKGKVMNQGLWAWSRHPNYFGECLIWWGFFAIGWSASHALWLVLSPIVMTFLLLQVSGVTLMEDRMDERRPGYGEYVRRVSAFVPWPPKG